jgi:hypothetical protein
MKHYFIFADILTKNESINCFDDGNGAIID